MSVDDPKSLSVAARGGEPASGPLGGADAAPVEVDLRGLHCPMPVLRTAKALRPLAVGRRIAVLASDPLASIDIPHFCREQGHVLEESGETGGDLRFVIRKGAAEAGA